MAKGEQSDKKQSFPRELFDQPKEARLGYFKAYTVAHPLLDQADKAVWNALREPAGALLVFVFGPTGIGKTTLLAHIEKRLVEAALLRMQEDQNHIPVLRLDAVAPAMTQFRWADYYDRGLTALREPLIDYKVDYHARPRSGVRNETCLSRSRREVVRMWMNCEGPSSWRSNIGVREPYCLMKPNIWQQWLVGLSFVFNWITSKA